MTKSERIKEIEELVDAFNSRYCDEVIGGFARELLARLGRKRKLDITRGRKEIWASAVVYVIARLNFLFDPESEIRFTADIICDFFETRKQTVATKATLIERACRLRLGEPGLCRDEISRKFTFVQTPEGFILPADFFDREVMIEFLQGDEAEELKRKIAENRQLREKQAQERKAALRERRLESLAREEEEKQKRQPSLF